MKKVINYNARSASGKVRGKQRCEVHYLRPKPAAASHSSAVQQKATPGAQRRELRASLLELARFK